MDGGFAEYCAYPAGKVFRIHNLSDIDATLIEPASCAAHGLEKIAPKFGSSVLMFGAGPTGLCLAQLLRLNGASNVVVAAPGGLKMDLARKLGAADVYVELSREDPSVQFEQIKMDNPYGFDIVVEVCTQHTTRPLDISLANKLGYRFCEDPRGCHSLRPPWRQTGRLRRLQRLGPRLMAA